MKKRKRNNLCIVPILIIFLLVITVGGIMTEHGIADVLFSQTDSTETGPTVDIPDSDISQNQTDSSTENKETEVETTPQEIPSNTETNPSVSENEEEQTEDNETTSDEETYPPDTTLEEIEPPKENVDPEKHGGTIYLTFDDGPSAEITPYILDILGAKGVNATFFIVGYKPGTVKEELVQRIVDEGHSLGLHGESHDYSKIYTSIENLEANFLTLQSKIFESTGIRPTIIRFPGGSSNTVSKNYCTGIMTKASTYLTEQGFVYFDWNVDSRDAGVAKTADEVYENVISGLKPGRRNIVLMHDSASKMHTLEALESIIDYGLENGYEFKVITAETEPMTHPIAN